MPLHLPLLSAPRAHVIGQGVFPYPRQIRSGDRSNEIHSICRINLSFVRFSTKSSAGCIEPMHVSQR